MGLRSRQRRLAGVAHEDSFDVETHQHRTQSLEEHLQASRRDVDDFNFAWKHAVGMAGLFLALYELALTYQVLWVPRHAPSSLVLCLLLKAVAIASVYTTRSYVQTGSPVSRGASLLFATCYGLAWAVSVTLLGHSFTLTQVSPTALIYALVSHGALRLIGDNTKAEVARAQQLEKLEQLFNQSK